MQSDVSRTSIKGRSIFDLMGCCLLICEAGRRHNRMTFENFCSRILGSISVGQVFDNPGGGTSTILKIEDDKVIYKRRNTRLSLDLKVAYNAYTAFSGERVSTRDLKDFDNSFDSTARAPAGHSCNCTFLFLWLYAAGLGSAIMRDKCFEQHFKKED